MHKRHTHTHAHMHKDTYTQLQHITSYQEQGLGQAEQQHWQTAETDVWHSNAGRDAETQTAATSRDWSL